MWAALQQEELRRDLVKCKLDGSIRIGSKTKEEVENVALRKINVGSELGYVEILCIWGSINCALALKF